MLSEERVFQYLGQFLLVVFLYCLHCLVLIDDCCNTLLAFSPLYLFKVLLLVFLAFEPPV